MFEIPVKFATITDICGRLESRLNKNVVMMMITSWNKSSYNNENIFMHLLVSLCEWIFLVNNEKNCRQNDESLLKNVSLTVQREREDKKKNQPFLQKVSLVFYKSWSVLVSQEMVYLKMYSLESMLNTYRFFIKE